jgi:hypothetical protein
MYQTIGTCSLCRGAVTVPNVWGGIIPPTPTCSSCGAKPANPHGPVIDMEPTRRYQIDYFGKGVSVVAQSGSGGCAYKAEGWDG